MIELFEKLSDKIKNSYEEGITQSEAEKLAGEFLYAQMVVAEELRKADLDARMKKSGLKALAAAVYMEAATKGDKKPSDSFLQNLVDLDKLVQTERESFDQSEVEKDKLHNYLKIFQEAHIHYRTIAKGKFE